MVEVRIESNFEAWRTAARSLLARHVRPEEVLWAQGEEGLLPGLTHEALPGALPEASGRGQMNVPRQFVDLARDVAAHREPSTWSLLYGLLFRLTHGEPALLQDAADPEVIEFRRRHQQVRRDVHKMHAFVRFRKVEMGAENGGERYVAFYRPDHRILRLAVPFFVERFSTLSWSIFTPDESAHFEAGGNDVRYSPGVSGSGEKGDDELEGLWCTYYASIFNPARIKLGAMKKEMPRRFWKHLPEAQQIEELLEAAPSRVEDMMARSAAAARADQYPTAEAFIPRDDSGRFTLPQLREASVGCRGCPICELGTRTVFGEGPETARAMFVGEQPGDYEDRQGRPFVGPAGQLLDEALERVGIDRSLLYVTNAVKHFKFEAREGTTRRIHAKPSAREITACKPWLVAETQLLKPQMIVALGATAAQAMMGPTFRITQQHGQVIRDSEWAPWWMATIHPSALLRIPDAEQKERAYRGFLEDLAIAAGRLREMQA